MKAWHFSTKPKLTHDDNRAIVAGETLTVDGKLSLCNHGLHASVNPLDAYRYNPGPFVSRVELGGDIIKGDDKLVSSLRTCLWIYDAVEILKHFGRLCALDVAPLWDAPDIVIRWLRTGDESIRKQAWDESLEARRKNSSYYYYYSYYHYSYSSYYYSSSYSSYSSSYHSYYATQAIRQSGGDVEAYEAKLNRRLTRMLLAGRPQP